jgi:putative hydrolase of the HAD superfamily
MGGLRAVFFDLDDTLCDTSATVSHRLYAALEVIAARGGRGQRMESFIDALYELPEQQRRLPQLLELLHVTEQGLIKEATQAHDAAALENLRLCEGALDVLEDLRRHVAIGLISNGQGAFQREKLARLGLARYFPAPLISEEVGAAKPDPGIFRIALERTGVHADEAVYVGNAWEVDILGAAAAGIRAVWVSKEAGRGPEAAHTISGIKHLPAVLRTSGMLGL